MEAALTLSSDVGIKPACESLDVPRSGFYRAQARKNTPTMGNRGSIRALRTHCPSMNDKGFSTFCNRPVRG